MVRKVAVVTGEPEEQEVEVVCEVAVVMGGPECIVLAVGAA